MGPCLSHHADPALRAMMTYYLCSGGLSHLGEPQRRGEIPVIVKDFKKNISSKVFFLIIHNGYHRHPDIYTIFSSLLVIIKHPASDINNHEKSGPAGCT